MTDRPHLHALLVQLLALDETDAQLPVPILINLNRRTLREPLLGLASMAEELLRESNSDWDEPEDLAFTALNELEELLDARYPSLAAGEIFRDPAIVDQPIAYFRMDPIDSCPELEGQHVLVRSALDRYEDDWHCYQPVASLHRLTWNLEPWAFEGFMNLIEAELSLDPACKQLILDMAARRR